MYLIIRVLDLELRINSIEKVLEAIPVICTHPAASTGPPAPSSQTKEAAVSREEDEEDDAVQEPNMTSEIDNNRLIEPQHFDSTEDLSARLKKMSLGQLTDIASEKKIDLSLGSRKLTKKALIEKIIGASENNLTDRV